MPYRPRKHQLESDIVYHLLNRANGRVETFHDDEDYGYFKSILKKHVGLYGMMIYHYCLMPNHYHLEAEFDRVEVLSSAMAGINRSYTHYYHKRYGTAGYLWQGRFKSKPIQKSEYLLSCARYIEANPVKAKIVEEAQDYPHSSARFYVLGDPDDLISINPLYEEFGLETSERRYNYSNFLKDPAGETENDVYKDFDEPLGGEAFKARLIHKNGRSYPRTRGRVRNTGIVA